LDTNTTALVARLPIGFQKICAQGTICIELLHILSRMNYVMSHKSSRSIPYNQRAGQYDDYLAASSLDALASPDDKTKGPSALLEALLTLGLILFSSTAFNDMRATPVIFRGPKDALFRYMLRSKLNTEDFDETQVQCYQWIWAVTIDSWRDAARELMPQGTQLLDHFHRTYASQWTTSEDLASLLKRFFYTEDLLRFHRERFERSAYMTGQVQTDEYGQG
jgi:hypothetical protein